jgi:hypothetical protein
MRIKQLLRIASILVSVSLPAAAWSQSLERDIRAISSKFDVVMLAPPSPSPNELGRWKYFAWSANELSLRAGLMPWEETEILASEFGGGLLDTRLRYSVRIASLSAEIQTDGNSLVFRCKSSGCITVRGTTRLVTTEPGTGKTLEADLPRTDVRRDENWWHFKSTSEAQEVASRIRALMAATPSR